MEDGQMNIDFSSDADGLEAVENETEGLGGMGRLSELVVAQLGLEDEIEELSLRLQDLNDRYERIRKDQIPTLMDELNLTKLTTKDGHVLELKDVVNASIPKEEPRRSSAFAWLKREGHGDIIKNEVKVLFGRGEDEKAEELLERLEADGLEPQRMVSVHPQTLSALVRTLRREGRNVDAECLSIYEAKIAKIKRVKPTRKRFNP